MRKEVTAMDGDDIVKVVEGEPIVTDPLDIWVLDDPARNGLSLIHI